MSCEVFAMNRVWPVAAIGLVVGLLVGAGAGYWWASRPDAEGEWCDRVESVVRAARAGAPWDEAVDEWTLAQGQPDWANDYNSFEVMGNDDPATRVGTPGQAQAFVEADSLVCDPIPF